ncbi:transglycosylase SLT domain-containing protein [Rubrivivax gelatinosus]|uniref:transglycosylase SLT domain-containing protein n=1 Tax=Rubrivivax gelatinosus TaxID=28068 RepID=UPI001904E6EF
MQLGPACALGTIPACLRQATFGPAVLLLAATAATAASPGPDLDAGTCAALRDAAGAKFSLGRAACGLPAEGTPAPQPVPRARQAQQLQLYGAPPAEPAPAPTPATAAADRPWPSSLRRALSLAPVVDEVARIQDVDPLLLHAIARVESRHDAGAVSPAGARGVMQLMPATAAHYGVGDAGTLHDAATNLLVGARHLHRLQQRYPGELPLVLAAYNAGEGAVERHGRRIPPYRETQDYVRQVLHEYDRLRTAAESLLPTAAR